MDTETETLDTLPELSSLVVEAEFQVRDEAKREVDVRLLPWGHVIDTLQGPEMFRAGAFDGTDPASMYMYGPEHELKMGVGQDGRVKPIRVPVGRGIRLGSDDVGPIATFRMARSAAGQEALDLVTDRIISTVSVEFSELPGGTVVEKHGGRNVRVHTRARLHGATPTHRPAYGDLAAVLAVRSQPQEDAPVTEATNAPAPEGAAPATAIAPTEAWEKFFDKLEGVMAQTRARDDAAADRLERMEELARAQFQMPGGRNDTAIELAPTGVWMSTVLKMLSGERVPDAQVRALDDLITTDNLGVVPPAYLSEFIGIIDPARPFLDSVRKIPTPDAGMSLILPKITQRPTVATQSTEKSEVDSTKTIIGTETVSAITKAGAGDISLQLLKRSSPSFLALYLELLAEAYAIEADDEAVDILLAAALSNGGSLDPNEASFGAAWSNGVAVSRRLAPDRIWLSSAAVAAFIDAKADGTNAPLYSNLEANFTAGGGTGGTISGLRPVHVPALDDEAVDIVVGPSRGYIWAEDGTYTLQVDVPAKAGRDVALVGILWMFCMYPAAFTKYTLAS